METLNRLNLTDLITYSYQRKKTGIISSKRNTKHPPNLLVHAPTTKTRHQPSRRTARATEVHEHAAASSWGDGMTRSASPAPESRAAAVYHER